MIEYQVRLQEVTIDRPSPAHRIRFVSKARYPRAPCKIAIRLASGCTQHPFSPRACTTPIAASAPARQGGGSIEPDQAFVR